MATGIDRSRKRSIIIFSDVSPIYPFDDIECRFYVNSNLISPEDKIGLYRDAWKERSEFVILKDLQNLNNTDEFGEKKITFTLEEMSGKVGRECKYQFCYFHWSGESYEFCDASSTFRINVPNSDATNHQQSHYTTSFNPELSINNANTRDNSNNTIPKTLYDTNPSALRYESNFLCTNEICKQNQKSLEYTVNEKERQLIDVKSRLAQHDKIKTLQIESLNANFNLSAEKCVLLETELKQKIENENRMEIMKHDLMDSIRLTEAKNSSLEEQLKLNEDENRGLKIQCSEQEELIEDLRTKLTLANSEIDKHRVAQSRETLGHDSETRFLREKLEELKIKCEKLKRVKECAQQEKIEANNFKTKLEVELQMTRENATELKQRVSKAEDARLKIAAELKAKEILMKKYIDEVKTPYKSLNDALIHARQQPKADITIYANDMSQEMKDYAISYASKSVKSYNDIKSIAVSIGNAFNEKYGQSWHCFVGENIVHTPFSYAPNTYLSFAIESLNIVLFNTTESLEYSDVILSARNRDKDTNILKTEWIDDEFEGSIVNIICESLDTEFSSYYELSRHLTRQIHERCSAKYGNNWLTIAGFSRSFDSSYYMANRRYMELKMGELKVIVLQIDEVLNPLPRHIRSQKV